LDREVAVNNQSGTDALLQLTHLHHFEKVVKSKKKNPFETKFKQILETKQDKENKNKFIKQYIYS